jgi:hypothetical protein
MRIGMDMRLQHGFDQRASPFAAIDMGVDEGEAGTDCGTAGTCFRGIGAMLPSIAIAERSANLRCFAASAFAKASADNSARQARTFAKIRSVVILLVGMRACAAFGKIIVPRRSLYPPRGAGWPPSR